MTHEDLIKEAALAEPATFEKIAAALKLIEHFAPEFMDDAIQEMRYISEHTDNLLKTAGIGDWARKGYAAAKAGAKKTPGVAGKIGLVAATGAGAGLLTNMATDLYDAAKRNLTKSRNWKRIMEANPNLPEEIHNIERLKPAFNSLQRYAPDLMADPFVGGAMLKAMANQAPGNEHTFVKAILDTRKSLLDTRSKDFKIGYKDLQSEINPKKKDKDERTGE
jgi:hypothetical protein